MRRVIVVVLGVGLLLLTGVGLREGLQPAEMTPQAQVAEIGATLRCPTCQGLSVADSPSKVATSMREIIAEQLAAGRSADEIRQHFVARYGDWILLSPRTSGIGWLVWMLPVMVIIGALGGLIIALRGTPRRRPAASPVDVEVARAAEQTWRQGRLAVPLTPAGERLEAALETAAAVRADQAVGVADGESTDAALHAVARALAAQRREATATAPAARHLSAPRATRSAATPRPATRRWAWTGAAAAFAVVVGGLLVANLAPRGAGDLPTGNLPDRAAAPDGAVAQEGPPDVVGELRAAVEDDPDDLQSRLQLAAQLLREPGGVDEARTHAEAVVERTGGQHPDGLLLLGITQVSQGDPAGRATLDRYLSLAPADHPGVDIAHSLLDGERR